MRRFTILFTALAAIVPAFAHSENVPFSFRDFHAGDPELKYKGHYSFCGSPHSPSHRDCMLKDRDFGTISDEPVLLIDLDFNNNSLDTIEMLLFASSFDRVIQAFTTKWGKPCETSAPTIRNGVGTTFTNDTAAWCFSDGKLTATRYGDKVTDMRVYFRTSDIVAAENAPPRVNF